MYGKIRDGVFWIMDAAALPVQGTETRVNAGNEVNPQASPIGFRALSLAGMDADLRIGDGVHGQFPNCEPGSWKGRDVERVVSLVSAFPSYFYEASLYASCSNVSICMRVAQYSC